MKLKIYSLVLAMLATAATLPAQTFTVLHDFDHFDPDLHGGSPLGGVVLSGNKLYGTATYGIVFSVNTDGSDYTELTNFDTGAWQYGSLVLSGDTLYGTSGEGLVYSVHTDGTGYTNLCSLDDTALAGLTLSGGTLYGTTSSEIFKVDTNGSNFQVIHNFSFSDGQWSEAALSISGNMLYGTTDVYGAYGNGTVFSITTNGGSFTVLHSFTNYNGGSDPGFASASPLVLVGSKLYGTVGYLGGSPADYGYYGSIFSINTDGTGFTNLYNFPATNNNLGNTDSDYPIQPGLVLHGNILYGATQDGGGPAGSNLDSLGKGSIYSINTDGSDFKLLWYLGNDEIGEGGPQGTLIMSGQTLYGTTVGGLMGNGYATVFSFQPPAPRPVITGIVLTTNDSVTISCSGGAGFTYFMQATTNLLAPVSWLTVSTNVADINGLWQFTDSITNGTVLECQTNLVYASLGTTNLGIGTVELYSTNVIGTNVICGDESMRFYRAATP